MLNRSGDCCRLFSFNALAREEGPYSSTCAPTSARVSQRRRIRHRMVLVHVGHRPPTLHTRLASPTWCRWRPCRGHGGEVARA